MIADSNKNILYIGNIKDTGDPRKDWGSHVGSFVGTRVVEFLWKWGKSYNFQWM